MQNCRVCKSENANILFNKNQNKYNLNIYTCNLCQSRYFDYNNGVHEFLHATDSSEYASHKKITKIVKKLFTENDIEGLKRYLSSIQKFKYIIDWIDKQDKKLKIAEIGCSEGYIGAYLILKGHSYVGYDISLTAINRSNELYGNYFYCSKDKYLNQHGPFDLIFLMGTIGCVEHPVEMVNDVIENLTNDGTVIFNSTNVKFLNETQDSWTDFSPPPDLVTFFHPDFWIREYCKIMDVKISEIKLSFADYISLPTNPPIEKNKFPLFCFFRKLCRLNPFLRYFLILALKLIDKSKIFSFSIHDPFGVYVEIKKVKY